MDQYRKEQIKERILDFENFSSWELIRIGMETKANLFSKSLFAYSKWEITSIGSFFAYVKHPYNNIKCDDIAKLLAKNCGLITIPGIYFGKKQENFLRMSIAGLSLKEIANVKSRLEKLEKYI